MVNSSSSISGLTGREGAGGTEYRDAGRTPGGCGERVIHGKPEGPAMQKECTPGMGQQGEGSH